MNDRTCIYCNEPIEKSDPSDTCYACDTEREILAHAQDFIDDYDGVSMYDGLDL